LNTLTIGSLFLQTWREDGAAAMEQRPTEPKQIHVLLVEDELLISEWVAQSLSEQGFAVQTAANAADALDHLAADEVDVLLTDINLPGDMDGAMLARRARELRPSIPVVYASSRATMLSPDARVPGAIILPKPYEPALLGRLLTAAMHHNTSHSVV
jgi:DNA-binding response OmpR family regulator